MIAILLLAAAAHGGKPMQLNRHNLSVSGPGPFRAQAESEVCVFCHVPHRGGARGNNRPDSAAAYIPYSSSTLSSPAPGAPTGASRVCLSCHDGTIAPGQTRKGVMRAFAGIGAAAMPGNSRANLGTDLRRTHPISFVPRTSPELRDPPPDDPVQLDPGGELQCTSCHDPHQDGVDPAQGAFLVKSNQQSALCTTCHLKKYWADNPSSHQGSLKAFDSRLGAHTAYATVRDNGCESCHRPHAAVAQGGRLLKGPGSDTCLVCHDGQVADRNIGAELRRPYAHPVHANDVHDAAEGPTGATLRLPEISAAAPRHVECADCHNPHAAYARPAPAPAASGFLSGVWGIGAGGQRVDPVQNEYEVCFKCHGDSANQPQRNGPVPPETLRRSVIDPDKRSAFDAATAASYHPVEAPGRNRDVPSLIPPWTASSIVSCGDCHGSDAANGPRGPHGSSVRHILRASYETGDRTPESVSAYALCYRCHDRTSILAGAGFAEHRLHVVDQRAPCAACHDSHGVSALQGNPVNNAHLINFDVSIVRPNAKGLLQYTSAGPRAGSCALSCHGKDHDGLSYSPAGVVRKRLFGLIQ